MRIAVSSRCFVPSPRPGAGVIAASYYTGREGLDLVSIHSISSRSDTVDISYQRRSDDNGRTWSETREIAACEKRDGGTLRRHLRGGYADPATGLYFTLRTEGVLPTDHPLEGMMWWNLFYTVSADGGRTTLVEEQVVQEGPGYSATHPLEGVWTGRNSVMLGDLTCRPLTLPDGTLLVPCQISPLGPDGRYANPGGGLTYHDAAVLRGRWRPDRRLAWSVSGHVVGDPARTTRGMIEPTIAQLADGRILMVMRGSNDAKPDLPGYKWHSFSEDDGRTWLPPRPWTYAGGEPFHSPSACSQLLAHSSGRLLWIGNICPDNPRGNRPRYPLVVGEVDRHSGLLRRDTVCPIDTRRDADAESVTLSNFYVREDRETGGLVLHLTRLFARDAQDWTADALVYSIALED